MIPLLFSHSQTFTFCAETCRPRETNKATDEETTPTKRQLITNPQPHRIQFAQDGGLQFEIKMAALIGLRGLQRGDNFKLATNIKDAGYFDDFMYTAGGRRYFLQLTHTQNPDARKLVQSDLERIIHRCTETYHKMEDRDNSEFILYTNRLLGRGLLHHITEEADVDTIFRTSMEGKIFKFATDSNKETGVHTLLGKSVTKSKEYVCLSDPQKESTLKKINEFLNRLTIFTGQKPQWQLDDLIAEEIRNQETIQSDEAQYKSIFHHFKRSVEDWWNNRREYMTPEMVRNWLQRAKTEHFSLTVTGFYNSCTTKLVRTGIRFSSSEISSFKDRLSNNRAVHLWSDAFTLCSILLLDCLPKSQCIFVTFESLQSNTNILLQAWLGGHWQWLTVFCDSTVQQSDISYTCNKITEIIKLDPSNKQVIILTPCPIQQVGDFVTTEHKFKFEQLSVESQERVLDKKIDFQGCEVTLRSALQRHGNVQHVLGPELVTDLITEGTAVNIGVTLQQNTKYVLL